MCGILYNTWTEVFNTVGSSRGALDVEGEMVILKNDTSVRVAPIPYCIFV